MSPSPTLRAAWLGAALAILSTPALAVPVWQETFDGDLADSLAGATDLGALTAEFNDITGTLGEADPGDGGALDDLDAFSFSVFGEWSLDVDFLDLGPATGLVISDGVSSRTFTGPELDAFTGGSGDWAFSLAADGSGVVRYGVGIFLTEPGGATVPEPLTGFLLGAGLLGLARRAAR